MDLFVDCQAVIGQFGEHLQYLLLIEAVLNGNRKKVLFSQEPVWHLNKYI